MALDFTRFSYQSSATSQGRLLRPAARFAGPLCWPALLARFAGPLCWPALLARFAGPAPPRGADHGVGFTARAALAGQAATTM
jgi:hypothetical protein